MRWPADPRGRQRLRRGVRSVLLAVGALVVSAGLSASLSPVLAAEPAAGTAAPTPAAEGEGEGKATPSAGPAASQPSKADLAYGAYQRGYYITAIELAEPLANLGDPAAQTLLGEIYSRGLGVKRDMKEAARWYQAAAKAGKPEAQFRYAMILLEGSAVSRDEAQARDLMQAAADRGLPLAEYNYGQMLIESSPSGGFTDAARYFEKAAKAGVPEAQYAMSQLFASGRGVTEDLPKARAFLHAAALNGFTIAQIEYGIWLINGKGGPAKAEEGFRFLRHAAALGNPIAINRVAHLYKDGIGTEPDVVEAAKWAVLAKRTKNSDAVLDDFFRGLDAAAQKAALEAANRFRSG